MSSSPYPIEKPCSDSTPSPTVAKPAAAQTAGAIRVRRISADSSGVSTTYSPVRNPETLAAVCASPKVCSSWAIPYSSPSSKPRRRVITDIRSRGPATIARATAAMVNRTVNRSGYGDPGDDVLDHEEGRAPRRGHRQQRDQRTELTSAKRHLPSVREVRRRTG